MGRHTKTTITIGGREGVLLPYPFEQLEIHQNLRGHHRFEMEIATEELMRQGADEFQELTSMVGEDIFILIDPKQTMSARKEQFRFKGLITQVLGGKTEGSSRSNCIIRGAGSPIYLEDAPDTASFKDKSLSYIYKRILSKYPVNSLRREIAPRYTDPLGYVVQYRENAYRFLQRLSARHGEWFYFSGEQLFIGRREAADPISLEYGINLTSFHYQLSTYPGDLTITDYDYVRNQTIRAQTGGQEAPPMDALTKQLKKRSESLFPGPSACKANQNLGKAPQRELARISKQAKRARLANLKVFHGHSESLDCRIGREITVRESGASSRDHGRYMITALSHRCTSEGDYENVFQAVPASVASPYVNVDDHPVAETQSAVVVDNNDPEDLGRVQVQLRWQAGRTPWLRMAGAAGGAGKGVYMIPEKGEEVLVGFAGGNPERPYVLGTVWNGGGPAGFGTPGNDVKAIKTRSGHTIELNDAKGGAFIAIKDQSGNAIHLDTKNKSITITAPGDMTLNAKNMEMNIQENLNINVGKSKTERITEEHTLEAKNSTAKILKKRMVHSGEKTEQQAGELIFHTSSGDMTLDGTGKVTIQSKDRIDFGE